MEGETDMPMVPLSWLADHVDVVDGTDAEALAAALVKVGLEEEEIHPARVIGPLVVGRVLTRVEETASNGKVVNYCRVDVGEYNDAPARARNPRSCRAVASSAVRTTSTSTTWWSSRCRVPCYRVTSRSPRVRPTVTSPTA